MNGVLGRLNFIIIILSTLAMFTPVFSGYTLGMIMLASIGLASLRNAGDEGGQQRVSFKRLLRPVSVSAPAFWLLLVLAALLAASGTINLDIRGLRHGIGNAAVKYVIVWFVYLAFWWRLAVHGKLWSGFAYSYAACSLVHCVYCLLQRQYGFDWAHGFGAELGPGRFAYGVYRISGFVGHPLTLGYCQALALVASLTLFSLSPKGWEKNAWLVAFVCSGIVLLFSGSRGPQLVVMGGAAMLVSMNSLLRHWKKMAIGAVILIGCAWRWGLFSRFGEITATGAGGDQRWMHWAVHWRIFVDHWARGIGPGAPSEAILSYYLSAGGGDSIKLAHNAFLQVAADYGLFGLIGVVGWLSSWGVVATRTRFVGRGILGLLVVTVLSAMTQNTLQDSEFVFSLTVWTMMLCIYEVRTGERSTT